jgi:hypothetical protein
MLGYPRFPLIEEFITYDMKYVRCANRMRGDFCLKKLRVIATTDCAACEQFKQGGRKK